MMKQIAAFFATIACVFSLIPQSLGFYKETYEAEEGKLTLDNGATAVIKNGELVLSNDTVVYYFKPAN